MSADFLSSKLTYSNSFRNTTREGSNSWDTDDALSTCADTDNVFLYFFVFFVFFGTFCISLVEKRGVNCLYKGSIIGPPAKRH